MWRGEGKVVSWYMDGTVCTIPLLSLNVRAILDAADIYRSIKVVVGVDHDWVSRN